MSQYIPDNAQRFYQPTFEYSIPSKNYMLVQTQRNPPIREASLNRNNSVSNSMILKPGKIQQNYPGKLKRQNSMKNSLDYKQNDPYMKNTHVNGHSNRANQNLKDSSDYVSEYDAKNSYCNPLIVKREKPGKDLSRQKIPNPSQARQIATQNLKNSDKPKSSFHDHQYQILAERISKMEQLVQTNTSSLSDHKTKIQKLEEFYQNQSSKCEQSRRHSRSITSSQSATPTFKELSDIMSLIQETKNYQMKNSEQYRKTMEEFRYAILKFRQELNETVKKNDFDSEIQKLKESFNSGLTSVKRKPSVEYTTSTALLGKSKQIESIQREVVSLKSSIQKLEENNTSLKADLVKFNVREKKSSDDLSQAITELNQRVMVMQRSMAPFNDLDVKRGPKFEGTAICFKVSQELSSYSEPSKIGAQSRLSGSSVCDSEERNEPRQCLTLNQKTYFIDKDGYLLDKDSFYLLNERNEQIRLSQKEIESLRKLKVLQ